MGLARFERSAQCEAIAIKILLHGLKGPIDGKTYPSEMVAMNDNSDEWVASILSYIRYEFVGTIIRFGDGKGKERIRQSAVIQPEDVKKIREQYGNRTEAWTIEELEKVESGTK